jgi:hypothetical protein
MIVWFWVLFEVVLRGGGVFVVFVVFVDFEESAKEMWGDTGHLYLRIKKQPAPLAPPY